MKNRTERKKLQSHSGVAKENKHRIIFFSAAIITILALLVGRLAYIQLYKGNDLNLRAVNQWIKEIPIGAQRGKIFDRNLVPLTDKEKSGYLILFPEIFSKTDENIHIISKITGISKYELIYDRISGTRHIALKVENPDEDLLKQVGLIKGVFPIENDDRYDITGLAAHVIGYINKIDNIGEKGLEKKFDNLLKKNQHYKVGAIVDAQKRMIPGLGYKIIDNDINTEKYNLVTTLDYEIQKIAEEELDTTGLKGSVIVLDAHNGDVLAMVSRPNYDPNNVADYLNSTNKELFNRAVQISYPPGSIFKLVVLAAALEENIAEPYDTFYCNGYEEIGDVMIKCSSFERGGHGEISLEDAFSQSCNSAFIQLGQKVGGKKIIEVAEKLGLGTKTGVELLEEIQGQLPSEDYIKGAGIGNISIGQGTLEVTPLQIAKMTLIIVNEGKDTGIHLVKEIIDENGKVVEIISNRKTKQVLSSSTAQIIQSMMERVVSTGTGNRIDLDQFGGAAGKTGSAEAFVNGEKVAHAWFTGYLPNRNPQYIITILIEEGGSGGRVAAPVFNKIAERIIFKKTN